MNPQFDPTPGLRLPEPSLDPRPISPVEQQTIPQQSQMAQHVQQFSAQPAAQLQQPVLQPLPAAQAAMPSNTPTDTVSTNEDAMDDAWINKAKAVVEQFGSDPYNESNALSNIKAEYLKSRHNISTKLGDGHE